MNSHLGFMVRSKIVLVYYEILHVCLVKQCFQADIIAQNASSTKCEHQFWTMADLQPL